MSGDVRTAALRTALREHEAVSAREEASLRRTLALLAWLRAPFEERSDPTHVTASAIVVDGAGRTLLHRHKRLGLWLQPGGHIDRGESPVEAAVRETAEETGLDLPPASPSPLHVDVHEGPRGHVHLDVRYLLVADEGVVPRPGPGESQDVAWFTYADAARRSDVSVADALRAATRRGYAP